jgi:coenzyme F420-reducing hydrogenase delta subunit/NAD-dependent dihydropyrimidine dehydrogenase PreA subunit
MGIDGEDSPGVIDGATFLREVNLGLRPALGGRVAVVGGGNVAIDAARTAARLGVNKVTVLYRRSQAEMPADPVEVNMAREEGIKFRYLVTPVRIQKVKGTLKVVCRRMQLGEPDASGRRRPEPVPESEFSINCDSLVTAIGQAPHTPGEFRVGLGRGSTIQVDPLTLTTNRTGVFAGGDAITGPATVTQALAAGRLAATRIDDYLQHRYPVTTKEPAVLEGDFLPKTIEMINRVERSEPPVLPVEARQDFRPEEQVYDWETAVNESRRCLRCGMGAEILTQDKCAACLTCVRVCPYHVPQIDDEGTVRIPVEQCLACGVCVAECPARAIVLRRPSDRYGTGEELDHILQTALESAIRPFIIGFGCRYGLFGTGRLAGLWRQARAGVWIIPVLCIAKVETSHIIRGFEAGADGIFIAGCGPQCARQNTTERLRQRAATVQKALEQLGMEPERLRIFETNDGADPVAELDAFVTEISGFFIDSIITQEVKP